MQRLAQLGMFPAGWISVLSGLVSKRAAVLITGGTGVGKTTLAKALLAQCDANDRIVTVEEVREL
ncbi:Flp pilus assembly complex ATPase component TadA, partial [Erysipelatoclostridium ramosum]|nr:Flp pilus assembly complex ATPase component TadA [Thomasclavelia ramosa]